MDTKNLLIIVNYNQEKEIKATLGRIRDAISRSKYPMTSVLVDDGSNDQSAAFAEQEGYTVLRHGKNRGVGAAIRTGIDYAAKNGFENVVIFSSNGKMQADEIERVLEPVATGKADYVQGSRFADGGKSENLTPFRRIMIPMFSLTTSALLWKKFTDITCGFRAYSIKWLSEPNSRFDIQQEWLDRYEFEYYVHFWACRTNKRILEVPVTIRYSHLEKGRKSHIKPITGWWSMIRPFVYLSLGLRK